MRINYTYRIYIFFIVIFILLSGFIGGFIVNWEKDSKMYTFEQKQHAYSNLIDRYIDSQQLQTDQFEKINELLPILPEKIRITIIDEEGNVFYDNVDPSYTKSENQLQQAEIKKAMLEGSGRYIRKSRSQIVEYLYYAVLKDDYVIRIGLPFTEEMVKALYPSTLFFTIYFSSFFVLFLFLTLVYFKSRKSLRKLKKSIIHFQETKIFQEETSHDEEIQEIQLLIRNFYNELIQNEQKKGPEQEKLLKHIHYSKEGISFFTSDFVKIYANSYFYQYLNILLNEPTFDVQNLFSSAAFSSVIRFIENPGTEKSFDTKLHNGGRFFSVHVIIFDDNSFEIIIRDISQSEKNRLDKAEMSNNIAHELRTPVTSVRGYLETLVKNEHLSAEKQRTFYERAYNQTIRLSDIVQDIALFAKVEERPQHFKMEEIHLSELLIELKENDYKTFIIENEVTLHLNVSDEVVIQGNLTLIDSIFRNLLTNALKYAGRACTIWVNNYMEDEEFYYFSFSDNGPGLEEKHLNHIFERFYRVSEGRTRDRGGSGLGLSIVKKAIKFHKGEIYAKNRTEGGLEFLFTLKKHI